MPAEAEPGSIPRDARGRPAFFCSICGGPLAMSDFHAMGLREPEPGETAHDYAADELVDDLHHDHCLKTRLRAG